jgi:hypothetical protein
MDKTQVKQTYEVFSNKLGVGACLLTTLVVVIGTVA